MLESPSPSPHPAARMPKRNGAKPKLHLHQAVFERLQAKALNTPWGGSDPPGIMQNQADYLASVNGTSSQKARASYKNGPIEVLPGLFLGDEFNSRDVETLAKLGITTIVDVAQELKLPTRKTPWSPPSSIRYFKLPWTHNELELASAESKEGFKTGCAIIADAMGIIDDRNGPVPAPSNDVVGGGLAGGVLVHCQCGVARSASLMIAFVMQSAAFRYDFDGLHKLRQMQHCYDMVQKMSPCISPNVSFLTQLHDWETHLTEQLALHDGENGGGANVTSADVPCAAAGPSVAPREERRWGKKTIPEGEWMRMRAEEERKEREEEVRARGEEGKEREEEGKEREEEDKEREEEDKEREEQVSKREEEHKEPEEKHTERKKEVPPAIRLSASRH